MFIKMLSTEFCIALAAFAISDSRVYLESQRDAVLRKAFAGEL
jgi:hypothetical protein